jgi:hypothetical protein
VFNVFAFGIYKIDMSQVFKSWVGSFAKPTLLSKAHAFKALHVISLCSSFFLLWFFLVLFFLHSFLFGFFGHSLLCYVAEQASIINESSHYLPVL